MKNSLKKLCITIVMLIVACSLMVMGACAGGNPSSGSSSPSTESNSPSGGGDNSSDDGEATLYPVLTVNSSATDIIKGQSFQIIAVVTLGKEEVEADVTYESSNENVITVDENGEATAVGMGEATVSVKADYNGEILSKDVQLTVKQAYTFFFAKEAMKVGVGAQMSVEYFLYLNGDEVVDPQIEWNTLDEAVATVEDGVLTGVGYGTTTLVAEYDEIEITAEISCYYAAFTAEINNFVHASRLENATAMNMKPQTALDYELVSEEIGGRTAQNGNFFKITATKGANYYPGIFVNPMISKNELYMLQVDGYTKIEIPLYLEHTADDDITVRNVRRRWNSDEKGLATVNFGVWTTIEITIAEFIANYDNFADYTDPLIWVRNVSSAEGGQTDFNIYFDAIYATKPSYTYYEIKTLDDFWNINADMSENAYYYLANDLDFSAKTINGTANETDGYAWHTIGWNYEIKGGTASQCTEFKGVFDGKGFALKNITVRGMDATRLIGASVFGRTSGIFKNVYVDMKIDSTATNNTDKESGFIGYAINGASIENCFVKLKTRQVGYNANESISAIAGATANAITIKNCVGIFDISEGVATTTNTNGNKVGVISGTGTKQIISNCYGACLVKSGESVAASITTSGVTTTGSALYNNLTDLFTQLKSGVIVLEDGWNVNYWKVENNALYFGAMRVDIA